MRFFSNYKEILYIQYNLEEKQPEKCDPVKLKKNPSFLGEKWKDYVTWMFLWNKYGNLLNVMIK